MSRSSRFVMASGTALALPAAFAQTLSTATAAEGRRRDQRLRQQGGRIYPHREVAGFLRPHIENFVSGIAQVSPERPVRRDCRASWESALAPASRASKASRVKRDRRGTPGLAGPAGQVALMGVPGPAAMPGAPGAAATHVRREPLRSAMQDRRGALLRGEGMPLNPRSLAQT